MASHTTLSSARKPPEIVYAVLSQLVRLRNSKALTKDKFVGQIQRLICEELMPHNFALVFRDLPNGCTRFIIKEIKTGNVCDLLDYRENGEITPDKQSSKIS